MTSRKKIRFWPTSNICYWHVYIFGISVPRRCWWANKNTKKLNFFSRPYEGWVKSKWALVEGKTTSRKKMPFVNSICISILNMFHLRALSKSKMTSFVNRSSRHRLNCQEPSISHKVNCGWFSPCKFLSHLWRYISQLKLVTAWMYLTVSLLHHACSLLSVSHHVFDMGTPRGVVLGHARWGDKVKQVTQTL